MRVMRTAPDADEVVHGLEHAVGWLRLQELLGYGIYPPSVGYVDGRHPRRVLTP